jgi:hypothetical protein
MELNSPDCNTEAEGGMRNEARGKKRDREKREKKKFILPHPSGNTGPVYLDMIWKSDIPESKPRIIILVWKREKMVGIRS